MAALTLTELVQLYAPLAGLLILAFWVGALSQRVKQLEKDSIGADIRDRITRLEVHAEQAAASLDKVGREVQGIHRWLANSTVKKPRGGNLDDILGGE